MQGNISYKTFGKGTLTKYRQILGLLFYSRLRSNISKMDDATEFSVHSRRDQDHSKSKCKQFQTLQRKEEKRTFEHGRTKGMSRIGHIL